MIEGDHGILLSTLLWVLHANLIEGGHGILLSTLLWVLHANLIEGDHGILLSTLLWVLHANLIEGGHGILLSTLLWVLHPNLRQFNISDNNINNIIYIISINSSKLLSHQRTRLSHLKHLLCTCSCNVGKKQVPFSMAIGNGEPMHEYFPKHSCMGTARMK